MQLSSDLEKILGLFILGTVILKNSFQEHNTCNFYVFPVVLPKKKLILVMVSSYTRKIVFLINITKPSKDRISFQNQRDDQAVFQNERFSWKLFQST